ncbi:hemerythrin [Desulfomarina profundi]|uniref:Hemerythrin n=1 Tax=Desulfomarina profundi TaxID=2772557 RepID=A0A8D5FLX0_9BACT|nr:bacteriohemerythrin [Desulfomarina profundi]BCL62971.1 hemerythrin [Desulfomarina profundi]
MEEIIWKDEFSVGIARMDEQHKKIIAMINRLIREQKVVTEPETVAKLLTEMTDYTREHFRAEEYLMSEYGYNRKDHQVKRHKEFIKKTMDFCSASNVGPNILSVALLEYLSTWLVDHILTEDMQYKAFFEEKGVV